MRKLLSLVLVLAMLASMGAVALAEAPAEHVNFTMSMLELGGSSYNDDDIYRYFSDKFNFDYEIWPITWDNWSEKDRIWINGGTMPDAAFWDFNFTELVNYAEQGLISPLPDGWETKYPNLYDMIQATGIAHKLSVDGKVYAIPRCTFMHFAPNARALSTKTIFYRMDWAKQLGLEIGPSITIDQLADFCRKAIDADLAGSGKTLGIAANAMNLLYLGLRVANPAYDFFPKIDGKYVWGPTVDGTVEGIERLRSWYEDGIIDPDFYLDASSEPLNKFATGLAACHINDGSISNYVLRCRDFVNAHPGVDPYEYVGVTTLVNNDGEWVNKENGNFWTAFLFSPDIDDTTFDRLLSLIDYTCTKEGQEIINMGLPGIDWDYNADGTYKVLRSAEADGSYTDIKKKYDSVYLWWVFTISADDFSYADPCINELAKKRVIDMEEVRGQSKIFYAYDPDYVFFASEAKSQYSVNIIDEVVRLILDKNADIPAEWNAFIEANRSIWEPVVNDLNAAFTE